MPPIIWNGYQIESTSVTVDCLAFPGRRCVIPLTCYRNVKTGQELPASVNGCNEYHGSPACRRCIANIIAQFSPKE